MKLLIKLIFYFFLFMAVMFGLGLLVLSAFRGNSDTMKDLVETIASSATGQDIQVGRLNHAQFYPQVQLDAESLVVMPAPQNDPPLPGYFIKEIDFSVPFWSIYWGQPVFQKLEVRNFLPKDESSWRLQYMTFRAAPDRDGEEFFATGEIHDAEFEIHFGMKKQDGGYTLQDNPFIYFVVDDYPMSGVLRPYAGGLKLTSLSLGPQGQQITGEILYQGGRWNMQLDCANFQMRADLHIDHSGPKPHVSGELRFPRLSLGKDFNQTFAPLIQTFKKLLSAEFEGNEAASFSDLQVATMDLQVSIEKLLNDSQELGSVQTDVIYADQKLRFENMTGMLMQGNVSGQGYVKITDDHLMQISGKIDLSQVNASQFLPYLQQPPELVGLVDVAIIFDDQGKGADFLQAETSRVTILQNGEAVFEKPLNSSGLLENFASERTK